MVFLQEYHSNWTAKNEESMIISDEILNKISIIVITNYDECNSIPFQINVLIDLECKYKAMPVFRNLASYL